MRTSVYLIFILIDILLYILFNLFDYQAENYVGIILMSSFFGMIRGVQNLFLLFILRSVFMRYDFVFLIVALLVFTCFAVIWMNPFDSGIKSLFLSDRSHPLILIHLGPYLFSWSFLMISILKNRRSKNG